MYLVARVFVVLWSSSAAKRTVATEGFPKVMMHKTQRKFARWTIGDGVNTRSWRDEQLTESRIGWIRLVVHVWTIIKFELSSDLNIVWQTTQVSEFTNNQIEFKFWLENYVTELTRVAIFKIDLLSADVILYRTYMSVFLVAVSLTRGRLKRAHFIEHVEVEWGERGRQNRREGREEDPWILVSSNRPLFWRRGLLWVRPQASHFLLTRFVS